MKVKSESEVAQSCLTLSMDGSLPGSSVHGIFQTRVLEWGAIEKMFIAALLIIAKKWKQSDFSTRFQKWKQISPSTNEGINVFRTDPHNRILLSNKKETTADTEKHGWVSETLC